MVYERPIFYIELEDILGEDLEALYHQYYIIYKLILSTGISSDALMAYRVKDLRGKDSISVQYNLTGHPSKKEHVMTIPGELRSYINDFYAGLPGMRMLLPE